MLIIFGLITLFAFSLLPKIETTCSISITKNVLESSKGTSNVQLIITNNGQDPICCVKFFLSLPRGSVTKSNRNMRIVGNNHYRTPVNMRIEPGASYKDAGLIIQGNGTPTVYVLKTKKCGVKAEDNCDENGSTFAPKCDGSTISLNNNVTPPSKDNGEVAAESKTTPSTNEEKATKSTNNNNSLTTTTQSTSGNTLVIQQRYTTKDTCLSLTNATGVIDSHMNTPMSNGIFTFYDAGSGGACGIECNSPTMTAAVSDQLFDLNAAWTQSCLNGKPWVRNDKVCINKCVRITYKNKTLTVPITNECPGCPIYHVDLSEPAFLWLEPVRAVGRAFNATITYITCAGQE